MSIDLIRSAREWWGKNVNENPVWRTEDLPGPSYRDILLSLNLAYEIRKDIIVLGKPETEITTLIQSYFWDILSCILKSYTSYAITGITAIHLYLGDESIPGRLDIFTKKSSTRVNLHNVAVLSIEKKSEIFLHDNLTIYLRHIKTNRNNLLILESPESLLIRLRPHYFQEYPQIISAFLKAIDFNKEILSELLLKKSKPITHLRLAALFEQVGKKTEAELIKKLLKVTTDYSIPGKSQIIKHPLPASISSPKIISDPVYITRFRDQLRVYADQLNNHFKDLILPHWDFNKILKYTEKMKKYDTYHSSTIEGYRVSEEEIQLLIDGREIILNANNREEIEKKMALKGYLEAHKYVLQIIKENFKTATPFTELTIREIYAHLFLPTVEAGLLDKQRLTQYRNDSVFIRNSRHVPPNYLKIDNLMRCLVEEVNKIEKSSPTQATIAHYGFVTIHPYFDGNGRVARFLMNYLLCSGGIPWITIRVEDRERYFKALEIAQCDEDILPFAKFIKKYLDESRLFEI